MVYSCFMPDAIVVQCGADALAHDPHGGAGLTIKGYSTCIRRILERRKPTLLLGGGGYNHTNTAKLWTAITALAIGIELEENIPEHNLWPKYGPDYTLTVRPLLTKDANIKQKINDTIATIKENLRKYTKQCEIIEPLEKKLKMDNEDPFKTKKSILLQNKIGRVNTQTDSMDVNYKVTGNVADVYEFQD